MFLNHPILQGASILLSIYVLYLGAQRFMALHLKHKQRFLWKRHVILGSLVLLVWLAGISGGIITVRIFWRGFLVTGQHGKTGLFLVPFILFGLITGFYMNKRKKKRLTLPLHHGVNNFFILAVALTQIYTGVGVYSAFVLGN